MDCDNEPCPCDSCDKNCDAWEATYCCELCRWLGSDYDCDNCDSFNIQRLLWQEKFLEKQKMQGGNIYRPCKGKENIIAIIKRKAESRKNEHK